METFGQWLRQRRDGLGLTRKELAERVGCSISTLRKIEDGERRPSGQVADLLANCLSIPPEERLTFLRVARGELIVERLRPQTALASTPAVSSPKSNLPVFPTPLIGRERELEQLVQLIADPQCRLLTLTGPGGIGKTRLAIETAAQAHGCFPDGVYFVSLASASTPTYIVPVIADALQFAFQSASPTDPKIQLFNYLKEKQLLLLADSLEHLLGGPGIEVLSELLANAPKVKVLATSRASLALQGEWVLEVHGLPLPQNEVTQGTSVELFLQRARRADIEFKATTDDYRSILRICRLVDGAPLGLELAAAWVRALSCAEIAEEISRGVDFLKNSARDVPERHRSMRAVFDHSWKLLSDEEQSVLSRLSVFRGGFSLDAAEQVARAAVFTLSSLVTKSLIRRSGKDRYELHELLRQYANGKLQANPEDCEATEAGHSAYYLELIQGLEQSLLGPKQTLARAEFAANLENIRPAWEYAVIHNDVALIKRSINGFWNFFETHTSYHEGFTTFGMAADQMERVRGPTSAMGTPDLVVYEYLRCCQAWCCLHLGKFQEARSMLEEGVPTLRSHGALGELSRCLHYLGVIYWMEGEYTKSLEFFHEKRMLDLPGGTSWNLGLAYGNLGMVTETMGMLEEARDYHQKGISIFRAVGDVRLLGIGLFYLGSVKNKLGLVQEGKDHLYESLEICRSIGDRFGISMACNSLGVVLQKEGKHADALQMFQEALNVSAEMGETWIMQQSLVYLGFSKVALGELADARACFLQALRLASEANLIPCILDSLAGIAQIYVAEGRNEPAMDLVVQVEKHPAAVQETRDRALQLDANLQAQLAPSQIAEIQTRAAERTLDEVVQEILG